MMVRIIISLAVVGIAMLVASAEGSMIPDDLPPRRLSRRRQLGNNNGQITIAAVQYTPLAASSPSATLANNAAMILSIAVSASLNVTAGSPPLELISFPEFALFGAQNQAPLCPASNATGKNALLGPYCETLPPVGTVVDCSAADASSVPYKIIACGLMTSLNPQTKELLVSYNTCMNNNANSPAGSASYYNTQVIVGGGKIVAIYNKYHPFVTQCFDTPPLGLVTFNTLVSNVTFGVFTCFDIMFPSPKEDLVHLGVKYFSYSAAIPLVFKAAVELFSGMNNVTVAASNLNGEAVVVVDGKEASTSCPMSVGAEPCVAMATVPLY